MGISNTLKSFFQSEKSLLSGISSVLNIHGTPSKVQISNSNNLSDYNAIRSDWEVVGKEFRNIIS